MKILAIIPSRGGSVEIPLKNIIRINEKPLQFYTISAALESKLITRTIVSTDNDRIAKHAQSLGAEIMKRPQKYATNDALIEPAIREILKKLKDQEKYIPDIIVLLQNTSPLRNAQHIDECIKKLIKNKYDSIFSCSDSKALVWETQKKSLVKPITYEPQKRKQRQEMANKQILENGAIYATKYQNFMKSNNRISGKIGYYKMPSNLSYEIDGEHDILAVEQMMKKQESTLDDVFSVRGKNIVLTGSSGLLGSHYAKILLARGANMALIDHSEKNSLEIKEEYFDPRNKIEVYKCDLSKPKEIISTFKKIKKDFDTIDVLINNAAFVSAKTFHLKDFKDYEKHPFDLWKKSFEVNVDAVHICCQQALGVMKKQKGGSIINISSNYGMVSPSFETYEGENLWTPPGYAVTKSAILNLTRYIANLYGKYNIRCNTFTPSGVATKKLSKKFIKKYGDKNAFGRMAKVSDYEGAIIFLCSDASSYMTGANLIVDGGWTSK
jgi:CMP-N-acetylneuraminic acid synthetase/NAD(P)-dependent dehydrogenase (short-subunit alcohol dehydrogenase family)